MFRFTQDNNVTSQSNFQNLNAANPVTNSLNANAFYYNGNQQDNPSTLTEKYNDDDQINESTKEIKGELNKNSEVINIADYVDYKIIPYNKTFNTQSNCKFNTHTLYQKSFTLFIFYEITVVFTFDKKFSMLASNLCQVGYVWTAINHRFNSISSPFFNHLMPLRVLLRI